MLGDVLNEIRSMPGVWHVGHEIVEFGGLHQDRIEFGTAKGTFEWIGMIEDTDECVAEIRRTVLDVIEPKG